MTYVNEEMQDLLENIQLFNINSKERSALGNDTIILLRCHTLVSVLLSFFNIACWVLLWNCCQLHCYILSQLIYGISTVVLILEKVRSHNKPSLDFGDVIFCLRFCTKYEKSTHPVRLVDFVIYQLFLGNFMSNYVWWT